MSRRSLKIAGQTILTLVALALIFSRVSLGDLWRSLSRLTIPDLGLLLVLTVAQVGVSVIRFWRLLGRAGARVPFVSALADSLVGLCYNVLLPTGIGGDVVRAYRSSQRVAEGHVAWSVVLFERIAGFLVMAAMGTLAIALSASMRFSIPPVMTYTSLALTLGLVALFFFSSTPLRLLLGVAGRKLPAEAASSVVAIRRTLDGPLATTAARAEALAYSLLYQVLGIAYVVTGARCLGASGHDLAIAVGIPLIHILSLLPVTLGGHGLREGLFVAILGQLGVPEAIALALAAQWLASSVLFALSGAAVSLFHLAKPPTSTP